MKLFIVAIAALLTVVSTSAQAKVHHRHHASRVQTVSLPQGACEYNNDGRVKCGGATQRVVKPRWRTEYAVRTTTPPSKWGGSERIVAHPAGCPRTAFCGCGVSVWAFGESRRDLWPASAYYRFARDVAASGNVAIWNHHVAGIISVNGDGTATLYDPNSGGHQTRIHTRSLRGATIVNPHMPRYALK